MPFAVPDRLPTSLPHTFNGFALLLMGCMFGSLLGPPAALLEGRDPVMVLEEHTTGHGCQPATPYAML